MKRVLELNNGMILEVVPHCKDNYNIAKYRLSYQGHLLGKAQCGAHVLPSQLKKFLNRTINCIWESDSILINDFLRSMYSEKTNRIDMSYVRADEVLMVATPSYASVRAPHTKGGRR